MRADSCSSPTSARPGAGDHRVAVRIVIKNPRRQASGRIDGPVERLRTQRHLVGVAQAVLVEERDLLVGALLVGAEIGGGGLSAASAFTISGGMVPGMLVWIAIRSAGAMRAICSVMSAPQSPPCATYRL